jgi:uncharacterized protein with HEPN domain
VWTSWPNPFDESNFAPQLIESACVPSERVAGWLGDIIAAVVLIETWIHEVGSVEALMADAKSRSAAERQLLIISEAAIRLWNAGPDTQTALPPEIDWAGIRGIGNALRHRYDDLDFEIVANVLTNKLADLRDACERMRRA